MNAPLQKPKDHNGNPLNDLSALLADDMRGVNTLILEHMRSDVPLIPQLAGYLIASGGKRIRPLLTLACTRLFGYEGVRSYGLAAAVEFIHTATLLHDDVVDESIQRRGKDAANVVFGNQASVLVGDFLFSRAFQLMVQDGSLEVLRILSAASAIIAEGEVMQMGTANNLATTMEDYLKVIGAKTAALFAAACEIGAVIAEQDAAKQKALRDYGYHLGVAFQITDDVLDYVADEAQLGKTVGDDFREGKMTAPVILALQKGDAEERNFWTRTMAQKDHRNGDLEQAKTLMKRHDTLTQGLALAQNHASLALNALSSLPNDRITVLLRDTAHYVVTRET